jgi:trimeric autotransporter adhesin
MPLAHGCGARIRRGFLRRMAVCLMVLALVLPDSRGFAASEHHGQVTFDGLPVPGATVTATRGDKHFVAITNQQGAYTFTGLDDGIWKFQVEIFGFAAQTQDVTIAADTPNTIWELKMLPIDEITPKIPAANIENLQATGTPTSPSGTASATATPPASKSKGFQRAAVNSTSNAPAPAATAPSAESETSSDLTQSAATGLLVNGSVNNGAASSFAQIAAFGNNRRGPGSLYNGGGGVIFDTSSWDAAPFSLGGLPTQKPSYNDVQLVGALGGPFGLPHHLISGSNFFIAYQHSVNDSAVTQWGRVPTMLERSGNLSDTLDAAGQPVQIYNPATGLLFPGSMVPVSTQAQSLLNEYPMPNVPGTGAYNYQTPVLNYSRQDSVQARLARNKGPNQYFGNFAYQRQHLESTSLFGFEDATANTGLDTAGNWSHRFNRGFTGSGAQFFVIHFKYEFSRSTNVVTPYFADRTNISGNAGITGNDQDPVNWGPPNLTFASGVAGFSEPQYGRNANQTQTFSEDNLWYRGGHNISFGADMRRQQFNTFSQLNARGSFAFTGAATQLYAGGLPVASTGSDLADFLLGIPDTASISFGNADKYLRGWGYDAFINDDWRINSTISLDAGLRWEHAQPFTELKDRLANLDIAPGFAAAATVTGNDPVGGVTGQTYPNSLLRPDFRGIEPRVGIAWRPRPTSSMVIRAGYGIYDNTSVYQSIAMKMEQQPPFARTLNLQNSAANPLTLATAFNSVASGIPNTFAVDPNFRVGYAQDWNLIIQQDLPGSLVMTATYLGTKGTRLMQEDLPNTFPLGATNPCPACPAGFVFLTSNGNSTREAGQIQLRRRLSNGLTATLQYTYAKANDDASSFNGTGLASGPSIAQNWLDLAAERGRSTFDQRNLLTLQFQYTTGEGIRGGALLSGWRGSFLREWTVTASLTAGSGFPETPVYLTNVAGTGVIGTVRPNYTGASVTAAPAGLFLNPAAFAPPALGQWGDAGRDSITGPAQFALNSSIGRTIRLGSRLTGDWRLDATNMLNTVTYTSYNTTVTSPLFGLANSANTMRKLQTTFRVRF